MYNHNSTRHNIYYHLEIYINQLSLPQITLDIRYLHIFFGIMRSRWPVDTMDRSALLTTRILGMVGGGYGRDSRWESPYPQLTYL
jgi:hypothetical protein